MAKLKPTDVYLNSHELTAAVASAGCSIVDENEQSPKLTAGTQESPCYSSSKSRQRCVDSDRSRKILSGEQV